MHCSLCISLQVRLMPDRTGNLVPFTRDFSAHATDIKVALVPPYRHQC